MSDKFQMAGNQEEQTCEDDTHHSKAVLEEAAIQREKETHVKRYLETSQKLTTACQI